MMAQLPRKALDVLINLSRIRNPNRMFSLNVPHLRDFSLSDVLSFQILSFEFAYRFYKRNKCILLPRLKAVLDRS